MASWHFNLQLVPRSTRPGDREPWRARQPAASWRRAVDAFLPRAPSWSHQLSLWGTEKAGYRVRQD
jgi:hypothetical protein